jgi:hypothetical protein
MSSASFTTPDPAWLRRSTSIARPMPGVRQEGQPDGVQPIGETRLVRLDQ